MSDLASQCSAHSVRRTSSWCFDQKVLIQSLYKAWVYTHRGSNPHDPNLLNTEEAAACLERYKTKAMELNGPEFDWLHSPVDARALYVCSCGRPHGKWAIFNGMVDDREAMAEVKSSRASSAAAKHQRREREEYERRQSTQDARVAKEYAQQMLEWSRSVHNYNSSMQRFMENVAQHTGMPCTAIPLPPPPPPPPPTFGISASPNPSPQNAHTIGSATGEENPDETLSRIAQGMFGGYVNASGSAGGSYSPDLDGGLTPF